MPPCLQARRAGPIPRVGVKSTFANPLFTSPLVIQTAARLAITPTQVALQWLLQLAPTCCSSTEPALPPTCGKPGRWTAPAR